jgi:acyl-CoA synthetase (NDP forming)
MDAFIKLPQRYGKPVIASSFADRDDDAVKMAQDNGIPCFRAPERAVRAMAALCQYVEIQNRK